MGVLLSIAVFVYAYLVLKQNKPLLRTDQDHDAKANYVVAITGVVFVAIGAFNSIILGAIALAMIHYRKPLINAVLTKVQR